LRLWRALPWSPSARAGEPGHPLWVPRELQGSGRHDSPEHYGCIYLSEEPVPAVAEVLAPFRGTGRLGPELLVRSGRRLALAALDLDDRATLVDLDDPAVLVLAGLRPSSVATGRRHVTQSYALALWGRHPRAAGLRWWSTLEASWILMTLFDRALPALVVREVRALTLDDEALLAAAAHLGLA